MSTRTELYVISDLNQIKALADPLRQQILASFVAQPRTTKQVGDLLGASPTKLYRHVDHLERVGLIELVETRPKRGTVEKYYRAIATRFAIAGDSLGAEGASTIEQSLAATYAAIQAAVRRGAGGGSCDSNLVLAFGSLRLSPEDLLVLKERMIEFFRDLPSDPADRKPFGHLWAIYPAPESGDET